MERRFYRILRAAESSVGIDRKRKSKGKSEYSKLGRFFALPLDILHHENWTRLSPHGAS
jgi:hypothetical protein